MFGVAKRLGKSVSAWLSPPVPEAIRTAVLDAQYAGICRQGGMLMAVAAFNLLIIMAYLAHNGTSFVRYGWMLGVIAFCVYRALTFRQRFGRKLTDAEKAKLLKRSMMIAVSISAVLGLVTGISYATDAFDHSILVPISLALGTIAIAFSIYAVRFAAMCVLFMGLFPGALSMLLTGNLEAQMLGLAMLCVGVVMLRVLARQYDQLLLNLGLMEENRRLALTDALTGIANRRAMISALEADVASGAKFAVALIDLDGFKLVNDKQGHLAGDYLLREVAQRLAQAVIAGDSIGRLGGDEFILLFRTIADQADCSVRADAVLAALSRPNTYEGQRLVFGASLGFAIMGQHGDNAEALLNAADEALYVVKRNDGISVSSMPCCVRLAA